MPIVNGSAPDLEFTFELSTASDVFSFPAPQKYELFSENFELNVDGNKVGIVYFIGSSFTNQGTPNSFTGTLDLGELGTIVFLFSIPPNAPINPETGFYLPDQTFYCRILQGSGNFKFIQNGFVVIYTYIGGRNVYVYLDK
jgi:hypothetical protein